MGLFDIKDAAMNYNMPKATFELNAETTQKAINGEFSACRSSLRLYLLCSHTLKDAKRVLVDDFAGSGVVP